VVSAFWCYKWRSAFNCARQRGCYLLSTAIGGFGRHHDLLIPLEDTGDTLDMVDLLHSDAKLLVKGANRLGGELGGGLGEDGHCGSEHALMGKRI
jgi:hypothetical protein